MTTIVFKIKELKSIVKRIIDHYLPLNIYVLYYNVKNIYYGDNIILSVMVIKL